MNLFLVNLDDVRLTHIDDEAIVSKVHLELERELVGAQVHDRRNDIPHLFWRLWQRT
jgi:hypothetical protein